MLDLVDDGDREVLGGDADVPLRVDHRVVSTGAVGAPALATAEVLWRRGDRRPPNVVGTPVDVERVDLVEGVLALGGREVRRVDETLAVLVLQRPRTRHVDDQRGLPLRLLGLLGNPGQHVDEGARRARVHRAVHPADRDDHGVRVLGHLLDGVPGRDVPLDGVRLAGQFLHPGGVHFDRGDLVPPLDRLVGDATPDLTRSTKNHNPRHAIASDSSVVQLMDGVLASNLNYCPRRACSRSASPRKSTSPVRPSPR
ncbi:hypothetical protein FAIPA1_10107 [Frankia sp. AiPs1]